MSDTAAVELSVVLPFYNEQESLEPMLVELEPALKALGKPFEVICVDDGSTDAGFDVLKKLQATRPWLRAVRHSKNSGQSAGYLTGFKKARGEIVITMDSDRQHDPTDIGKMLGLLTNGVAAVCGIRAKRQDNWVRRASSRIANRFARLMTGGQMMDAGCTFRVMRRSALGELPPFNGLHRFLPTILRFQGYEVIDTMINHRPRLLGTAKYGIGNRLWRGILDCLAIRWYRARCLRGDRVLPE